MKKNLVPLMLFCLVFLAYSIYFVKVINSTDRLEPNSIAKSVKRSLEQAEMSKEKAGVSGSRQTAVTVTPTTGTEPMKRYVNYTWLNVRKDDTLSSPVLEKIVRDDEVLVLSYPSTSWAYIKTKAGTKGYVASRYLSEAPSQSIRQSPVAVAIPTPPKTPAPVSTVMVAPTSFKIPTITYHHITDEKGYSESLALAVVNFDSQLDYLVGHHFKSYTFYDLKAMKDGKMAQDKGVILTFNDGYADAYLAAQHLNGKGLKGVFFIITSKVGTPGYLDWRQIKKMRGWGMEIGSSGVNGADLSHATEFYINDELKTSKATIEAQLGEPVITFAYPSGRYTTAVMKAVEAAGYLFARTVNTGSRYTSKDLYQIPTLRVFSPAASNQFRAWLGE